MCVIWLRKCMQYVAYRPLSYEVNLQLSPKLLERNLLSLKAVLWNFFLDNFLKLSMFLIGSRKSKFDSLHTLKIVWTDKHIEIHIYIVLLHRFLLTSKEKLQFSTKVKDLYIVLVIFWMITSHHVWLCNQHLCPVSSDK